MTIRVERVEIAEEANEGEAPCIVVTPYWSGVDVSQGVGYALNDTASGRKLAERLKACMMAMAMYPKAHARTNKLGKTYASSEGYPVMGRTMNADLKRLEF